MNQEYMRINELVRRSGVPRTTIHFYLREGLLHPPVKTGRTMAYYNDSHLRRLQLINKLKVDHRLPMAMLKERLDKLDRDGMWEESAADILNGSGDTKVKTADSKRRKEIIDASIRVFSQKGYHHTKVQDITSLIGISTGTFYIYFKNKRDLFMEVIDDVFRTIVYDAAKAIRDEGDPFERLKIRGKVFFKNYSKFNEILYQLRAEMASEDNWPQDRVKQAYLDLTRPVIREMHDASNKGYIRPVDPDLLAYALTGIIEIMSLRLKLDNKYTYDQVEKFITDFMFNGIGLRPQE
ncbi:MAG: MerR family transcriptional regulator [Bacillota bacterium]